MLTYADVCDESARAGAAVLVPSLLALLAQKYNPTDCGGSIYDISDEC
jgi:hypothetical protein